MGSKCFEESLQDAREFFLIAAGEERENLHHSGSALGHERTDHLLSFRAQAQVHQLEAEIAILSSLDRIEQAAKGRLGMAPANGTLYIQVDQAAPDAPLVPRPLVGIRQNQEKESASLWQSILKALRLF